MPEFIVNDRDKPSSNLRVLRTKLEQSEHDRKVMKALKENLNHLLQEMSVGDMESGTPVKKKISLRDPGFVFDRSGQGKGGGQGGKGQKGKGEKKGSEGDGEKAGDESAPMEYEKDIMPEEIISALFDLVDLPVELRRRVRGRRTRIRYMGTNKEGPRSRLDRRATFLEKRKREIKSGEDDLDYKSSDKRYKAIKEREERSIRGRVYLIRDRSGSMGDDKLELMKALMLLVYWLIRKRYGDLEVIYIAHDTSAEEVSGPEFWNVSSSGGTTLSSGVKKALELEKEETFPGDSYVFQFSDGQNKDKDNEEFRNSVKEMLESAVFYAYVEVKPGYDKDDRGNIFSDDSLAMKVFRYVVEQYDHLHLARLTQFEDVGDVFLKVFDAEDKQARQRRQRR